MKQRVLFGCRDVAIVDLNDITGIDNAMEACAGLSDPNRWVSIQILYSENMLSILIINQIAQHNSHIYTRKPQRGKIIDTKPHINALLLPNISLLV